MEEGGAHSHGEGIDSAAAGSDFEQAEKEAVMQAIDTGIPLAWHPYSFGAGD